MRITRMLLAAIVGIALTLTSVTAASAQPGHTAYFRAATQVQVAPSSLTAGSPVIIHESGASGLIGYVICLYRSQNDCVSDTATAREAGPRSVIGEILTDVGNGITVWTVIKAAHASYKWIKKYVYNGKHVSNGKGAGLCMADFAYNQDAALKSCGDRHGIYWQVSSGKFFNTYARGDLIASSLRNGTRLFVHSAEDWSTWIVIRLCANHC